MAKIKFDKAAARAKFDAVVAKIGKRNLVIIAAALIIGAAVLVNQLAFADSGKSKLALDLSGIDASEATADDALQAEEGIDYFNETVLSRQKARDEAMEVLLSVAENTSALQEAKDKALDDISQIALDIEREANIESLIAAKGFAACVAVVNGSTASVIVQSDGLMANELAQIYEIVYTQAGIEPANLRIIEKGA